MPQQKRDGERGTTLETSVASDPPAPREAIWAGAVATLRTMVESFDKPRAVMLAIAELSGESYRDVTGPELIEALESGGMGFSGRTDLYNLMHRLKSSRLVEWSGGAGMDVRAMGLIRLSDRYGAQADPTSVAVGSGAMAGASTLVPLLREFAAKGPPGATDLADDLIAHVEARQPNSGRIERLWSGLKALGTSEELIALAARIEPLMHHLF